MNEIQASRRRERARHAITELANGQTRTRRQLFPPIDHTDTDGIGWETHFLEELEGIGFAKRGHTGGWFSARGMRPNEKQLEECLTIANNKAAGDASEAKRAQEEEARKAQEAEAKRVQRQQQGKEEATKAATKIDTKQLDPEPIRPNALDDPNSFESIFLANVADMRQRGVETKEAIDRIDNATADIFGALGPLEDIGRVLEQMVELMKEQRDLLDNIIELTQKQNEQLETITDDRRNRPDQIPSRPREEPTSDRGRYSRLGR